MGYYKHPLPIQHYTPAWVKRHLWDRMTGVLLADANSNSSIVSAAMQPNLGLRGKLQSINDVRHEPQKETYRAFFFFVKPRPPIKQRRNFPIFIQRMAINTKAVRSRADQRWVSPTGWALLFCPASVVMEEVRQSLVRGILCLGQE